jgi:hypothetical protein
MNRNLRRALHGTLFCSVVALAAPAFAQDYDDYVAVPHHTDHGFSTVGSPRANNGTPATTSAFVGGGAGVANPSAVVTSPTAVSYNRELGGWSREVNPNAVANADQSANGYSVVTGKRVRPTVRVREAYPDE